MDIMATMYLVRAIVATVCDECDARHQAHPARSSETAYEARQAAARDGWQVKPNYGKGSRIGRDLCPMHREVSG